MARGAGGEVDSVKVAERLDIGTSRQPPLPHTVPAILDACVACVRIRVRAHTFQVKRYARVPSAEAGLL